MSGDLCERSSFYAVTLFYTVVLALLTYLRVCSAFFVAILLLFSLVFRCLLWDAILRHFLISKLRSNFVYCTTFVLCQALSVSMPFIFSVCLSVALIDLFVPLTGRSGSYLPPDLVLSIVLAALVCITTAFVVRKILNGGIRRKKSPFLSFSLFLPPSLLPSTS